MKLKSIFGGKVFCLPFSQVKHSTRFLSLCQYAECGCRLSAYILPVVCWFWLMDKIAQTTIRITGSRKENYLMNKTANFHFDSRAQLYHSTEYIFRSCSFMFSTTLFAKIGKMPLNFGSIVDDNVTKASFQSFNRVNHSGFDVKTEFSTNTIHSFGRNTEHSLHYYLVAFGFNGNDDLCTYKLCAMVAFTSLPFHQYILCTTTTTTATAATTKPS